MTERRYPHRRQILYRPLKPQSSGEGEKGTAAAQEGIVVTEPAVKRAPDIPAPPAAHITAEQALQLEARCEENNIPTGKVKKLFGVDLLKNITAEQLAEAHKMIDITLENRKASAAV